MQKNRWLVGRVPCLAALLLCGSVACQCIDGFLGAAPAGFVLSGRGVELQIENQSGVAAEVEATYRVGTYTVRETRRLLAASGVEAEQTVAWTPAELIQVTAWVADEARLSRAARLRPGDVLASTDYRLHVDFWDGDTLVFVVPPVEEPPEDIVDCNDNGISDALDIAGGGSADCNTNGVPDECDIAEGDSDDVDANGVPDECERQACCLEDGVCIQVAPWDCAALDGTNHGEGTDCAGASCPQPEACCFDDDSCEDLLKEECLAQGGEPKGAETVCDTTECLVIQACCFEVGGCLDLRPAECVDQYGTPQGPGTQCSSTYCPMPHYLEACCLPDGSCEHLKDYDCLDAGGDPQGPWTYCGNTYCPPVEACCFEDLSCSDLEPYDCWAASGVPQGEGTKCETTQCLPPSTQPANRSSDNASLQRRQ